MTDRIISFRINQKLYEQMKLHRYVNWSEVIRRMIEFEIRNLDRIDYSRARKASVEIDRIRKLKVFDKGEEGTRIIRKWRERRKF